MDSERLITMAGSEATLDALPIGIALVDGQSRRIVYRNREALKLIERIGIVFDGTDIAAMADFRWPDGVPLKPHEMPGEASIERGETVREMVFTVPCLDGGRLTVTLDSVPVRSSEGTIIGAMLTPREVPDEKDTSVRLVQSERKLAADQRRRNFLTFLSEVVRDVHDAGKIVEAITRLTGTHLQVDRCSYGTVDVGNDAARVFRGYDSMGASEESVYRLTDFGPEILARAKAGHTDVIRDAAEDPRTRDFYARSFAPSGVRAMITVPLIKDGKFVAVFIVNQSDPREWTSEEIRLVEEVADRAWGSIERVNSQRLAAQEEAKYRTLIEELPQLAWTALPDGGRNYVSPQWLEYTGLGVEEGLGDRWIESIHPEDQGAAVRGWKRAVENAEPYDNEYRLRRIDGEYEYFHVRAKPVYDADGVLIMWIGTNHNIHQRLVDQEELRSKALRQQQVAAAFNRIALCQTTEDILRTGTELAREALGAQAVLARLQHEEGGLANWAGALEGQGFVQTTLGATPDIERMAARVGQGYMSLKLDLTVDGFREKLRRLGLDSVTESGAVSALAAPMQDSAGSFVGTLFYFPNEEARSSDEDGSVLVQFAQIMAATLENIRLTASLEERVTERTALLMQKVEDLESFSYIVSHDLRAPLRAIVGNARLVLMDEGDRISPEGKAMLERLTRASMTMSQLVDDLLEYARIGTKQPVIESVDVSQLATSVAADVRHQYPDATIDIAIPTGPQSDCDPRLIGLVLTNLIDNGCKYAKAGEPPVVEVGREGDIFFVRDQGIGFDMAYVDKLFKPFSRLHSGSKYAGTGIGLANVARILERHGGRIWVESAMGVGTTFSFTLGDARSKAVA